MADYPAMPLWTDAYLADASDLTAVEHGLYLVMLIIAWRRPDNALPDDMPWLRRAVAAHVRDLHGHTFNANVPALLARFYTLTDGKWRQKRLDREREFLRRRGEAQRVRAAERWRNNSHENSNKDLKTTSKGSQTEIKSISKRFQTLPSFKENQMDAECRGYAPTPTPTPTPTLIKKEPPIVSPPYAKRRILDDKGCASVPLADTLSEGRFNEFWGAYPSRVGREAARKAFFVALARAGPDEIVAGARAYAAAAARDGIEPRYVMGAAKWLREGRWTDEHGGDYGFDAELALACLPRESDGWESRGGEAADLRRGAGPGGGDDDAGGAAGGGTPVRPVPERQRIGGVHCRSPQSETE